MPTPLIRLSLSFITGMAVANFLLPHLSTLPLFLATCSATALLFFLHTPQPTSTRHRAFVPIAILTAFLIGMTLFTHKHNTLAHSIPANSTRCIGTLASPPQAKSRSTALTITQANGSKLMLYVGNSFTSHQPDTLLASLSIGDTILATIRHLTPTANAEGEFASYRKYLFRSGIVATAYVPPHRWQVRHSASSPTIIPSSAALQHRLHTIYFDHGINGEAASVIEAMTIGRKTELDASTRSAYASSGASHVLALSGYHIGVLLAFLQCFLLARLFPIRHTWIANSLIIIVLWAFAFIAGTPPSLVRATTMCTIYLICQSLFHRSSPLHSIAITATLMLGYNPLFLFDVGFQLSFISVFAIIIILPKFEALLPQQNIIIRRLLQLIIITTICSLATAPLVAYYFGRIPLLSILTNLAITLIVSLIIITSVLWWITLCVPAINSVITLVLTFSADTLNSIVNAIASIPHSSLEWHPSAAGIVLTYLLYAVLYVLFRNIVLQIEETQN